MGPHCSFCGTSTGPFSEVEGLFTVLMCTRCRAIRHASLPELLAHHDPGEPWLKWGCPIQGCGHRVIIPHELEGHTAAEIPAGSPATNCSSRIRTSWSGSSTVRSRRRPQTRRRCNSVMHCAVRRSVRHPGTHDRRRATG